MKAEISIGGTVVTFDGEQWDSEDKILAKLAELNAEFALDRLGYYPNYNQSLVEAVAEKMQGKVLKNFPSFKAKPGVIY